MSPISYSFGRNASFVDLIRFSKPIFIRTKTDRIIHHIYRSLFTRDYQVIYFWNISIKAAYTAVGCVFSRAEGLNARLGIFCTKSGLINVVAKVDLT